MLQLSKTRAYASPRHMARKGHLAMDAKDITAAAINELATKFGIVFDHALVADQIRLLGVGGGAQVIGDAAFVPPATMGSIPTPVQFLQTWLPGFIKVMTSARKIDDLIGIKTVGSWEDEEIVQGIVEPAATATEYGDMTNIPLANWNTNFIKRTIVRGELGMQVGLLEEGRSAAMRLSSSETKRQGAAVGLEIFRNGIGFYGWNAGNNQTYGFLNDPNLPAYIASSVAGGWASAAGTFQSITGDLRMMIVQLRTQSQDQIDPEKVDMTLALPTDRVDYLSVTTDYGVSVRDWLTQTYPKVRVVSAPELINANAGAHVGYLFAEEIDSSVDGSTDGGETFAQLIQTKFMTLGVEKRAKSYVEDYSNGSAGTLCKRPWAVVRVTGL